MGAIIGTGVDLVENERMREFLARWGALGKQRLFLARECAYCDAKATPWLSYAGRFAVKEAVSKAFGTGIGNSLGWRDIEVVRDAASGAPSILLHGKAKTLASARGVSRVWVSLAHTRHFAVAHALLEGEALREGTT